ncbi:MAG: T9SS type A sorting domain-containing protein [Crocinitomicaceae bacterium]|nr:T9SS type A sorting domain-containing protein [Crocinitomicaceae bacterium]
MRNFYSLFSALALYIHAFGQCTTTNATSCECADGTTNCLLLPDITASWQGIADNGWIEYPQNGAGQNFNNQGPDDGRLRVTGSTPNIGHGSFTVRGVDSNGYRAFICGNDTIYDENSSGSFTCPNGEENPKQMLLQRVYKKEGNTMSYEDTWTGSMTYHESHGHNHVDDWAVMTLRIPTTDPNPLNWPIVGDGAKIGFCLMDYGQCGTTAGSTYYGHCRDDNTSFNGGNVMANVDFTNWNLGGGSYGCSVVEQGISSGWTDVYGYWLDGMWINIPENTCNGDYYIVMEVDKNNYFQEEDEDNNYTAVPVTLTQQHPENSGILPTINSNESNNLCLGQTITLTATAGTDFLWSNGATTQSIVVSEPGSYECTVTNFCGSNTSLPFVVSSAVPSPPVVEDVSACTGTYVVLEASSTGEIEWFDDNGNFLNNGITHTTNPLIENMTIWVQNTDSYTETVNAEPYTNGIGGGGYLSSNHGSIFHAYTPFTLKSVLLYALNGGSVTIELQEEDGTVIQVFTETVPAGASRINLNFEIPIGYNYQLVGTNLPNGGLYRNNNSATYPYILDDILSIVGATSSSSYFYYFYDWEIETENGTCTSDLIPVQVTVADPDAPIAEGTTICTNEVAQLTASGSGTLNWLDALGTILGSGPNFSTPTLTETTTFYVQASENNCTSISVPVEVLVESCADLSALTIKNTIGISPNPSNGIFLISYDLAQKNKVEIEIISTTGKRIFKKSYQDQAGENNHEISLKNVSDGIYSIIISSGQEIYTDRLVIQND